MWDRLTLYTLGCDILRRTHHLSSTPARHAQPEL